MAFNFNFFNKPPKVAVEDNRSFEQKRRDAVAVAVNEAQKWAPSEEEQSEYMELRQLLILKVPMMEKQYKRFNVLQERIDRSTVVAANLNDFRYALESLGLTKEGVDHYLAHENAHANKASSVGAAFESFNIAVIRLPDGSFAPGAAYADFDIPKEKDGWSVDRQKKAYVDIMKAPDEYGNEMSHQDKVQANSVDQFYGN